MDDGIYIVAVKVTDDDRSTDIAILVVTVCDLGPTAILNGDSILDEGQPGNYDASGSTSPADSIVSFEWDWDYDGATFNPYFIKETARKASLPGCFFYNNQVK